MRIGRLEDSSCLPVTAEGTEIPRSAWGRWRSIHKSVADSEALAALYRLMPLGKKQTAQSWIAITPDS